MKKNMNQPVLRFVVCKGFTKEILADFGNINAANGDRDDRRRAGELASVRVANRKMLPGGTFEFNFI